MQLLSTHCGCGQRSASGSMPPRRLNAEGKPYRYARRVFPNGDIYEGEFIENLREGKGIMRYSNGARYEGSWRANQYEGLGTLRFGPIIVDDRLVSGRVYSGQWKGGLMHGKGLLKLGDGGEYEGMFKGGFYCGKGKLVTKEGDIMEGEWGRGRLSGHARVALSDGTRYVGQFLMGEYCGKGKLKFNFGRGFAHGDFDYGRMHGVLTREYMNGNIYEGSFRDGEPQGEGVMHYKNGDVYVGLWQSGAWHGQGVFSQACGDRYAGQFVRGVMCGVGRYSWRDGGSYDGEYRPEIAEAFKGGKTPRPKTNGLRHGMGVRIWASGARYEGPWVRDKMEGEGTYTGPDGCPRYCGGFQENHMHGTGRLVFGEHRRPYTCPLGIKHSGQHTCTFEGHWERGQWRGKGTFRCASGRVYTGHWVGSKLHGWGAAVLMQEAELGDPRRLHIGGVGGLYRLFSYSGKWESGRRHGFGVAQYSNGDRIICNFKAGHPEGIGVYVFSRGLQTRPARWGPHGQREEWLEWTTAEPKSPLVQKVRESLIAKSNNLFAGDLSEVQRVGEAISAATAAADCASIVAVPPSF